MSVKLEGFVKPFRGRGDNWDLFWSKFSVLADVSGWDTEAKYMARLPLFIEGDAFLVFSRMDPADKKKEDKVKDVMVKSFSAVSSEAYTQFTSRKLKPDESPDAFVADLRRLLESSGHKVKDNKDAVMIAQLLAGLPRDISSQVRLAFAGKEMTISGCLDAVRALSATMSLPSRMGAVAASNIVCHHCRETGHIRKHCPKRKANAEQGSSTASGERQEKQGGAKELVCYFCDKKGHMKKDCLARKQWLSRQSAAAAQTVSEPQEKCICTVSRSGELPRIYVHVNSSDGGQEPCRLRTLVDTGSTRTIIGKSVLSDLGLDVNPTLPGDYGIVALDGEPLDVLGTVDVNLSRLDGPVYLAPMNVTALVVPSLRVVNADALIGSDVVQRAGGLHLDYDESGLCAAQFGSQKEDSDSAVSVCGAASVISEATVSTEPNSAKLSRHIEVSAQNDDVILTVEDGEMRWRHEDGYWEVKWNWLNGRAPASIKGPSIGEYSREKLSEEEELSFCEEVQTWIDNGVIVKHDASVHGEPVAVLPFMAVSQQHKSTPVRPVLDYRNLNDTILSMPGTKSPVCDEKLRKWRMEGDPTEFEMLDIRKAYLQVRVSPELLRYQTVLWQGQCYVMTRMGFGLSVAPKFMDTIIRYITRNLAKVDNYVDDLMVPKVQSADVVKLLEKYGLPTKPAEKMSTARVLGLQLSEDDHDVKWSRRSGASVDIPEILTRRSIFSWCGRVLSHYPVCSWLRPCCSWVKRIACETGGWDSPVPDEIREICLGIVKRIKQHDPVAGRWQVDGAEGDCSVHCDASDLALGAVVEVNGCAIEDGCWLRAIGDCQHINIAELDAVIKGLIMASKWNLKQICIVTDSKTVAGWLRLIINNISRVKTSGLQKLLVERRMQTIEDMIVICGFLLTVHWVPSAENHADCLTRVPAELMKIASSLRTGDAVAAVIQPLTVIGPVSVDRVREAQRSCPVVSSVIRQLNSDAGVTVSEFKKVRDQLVMGDELLCRNVKLPLEGTVSVPVIPKSLEDDVLHAAHVNSGHASWETMYRMLRCRCYFPHLASACQQYVSQCARCAAANPRQGPTVPPTRADIPGRPWGEVAIDVLELGPDQSARYHCVLVCIDVFTKWLEVVPLRRHDGPSVAAAFTSICRRWGAPDVIRVDNGSEFSNAIVSSLFRLLGAKVCAGATRHPQSQGAVERANRTILGLIRKVLEYSSDWKADIETLLFYYRVRPHSATGISPMKAMVSWECPHFIVEGESSACSMSEWAAKVSEQSARIRDLLEEELSESDAIESDSQCPYAPGESVLLQRPGRHQKRLPPYESGWVVKDIVSKSTVVVAKPARRDKIVNIALIKPNPAPAVEAEPASEDDVSDEFPDDGADADDDDDGFRFAVEMPTGDGLRGLRNRDALRRPGYYDAHLGNIVR